MIMAEKLQNRNMSRRVVKVHVGTNCGKKKDMIVDSNNAIKVALAKVKSILAVLDRYGSSLLIGAAEALPQPAYSYDGLEPWSCKRCAI
jgi:hypothetical protein